MNTKEVKPIIDLVTIARKHLKEFNFDMIKLGYRGKCHEVIDVISDIKKVL